MVKLTNEELVQSIVEKSYYITPIVKQLLLCSQILFEHFGKCPMWWVSWKPVKAGSSTDKLSKIYLIYSPNPKFILLFSGIKFFSAAV